MFVLLLWIAVQPFSVSVVSGRGMCHTENDIVIGDFVMEKTEVGETSLF